MPTSPRQHFKDAHQRLALQNKAVIDMLSALAQATKHVTTDPELKERCLAATLNGYLAFDIRSDSGLMNDGLVVVTGGKR